MVAKVKELAMDGRNKVDWIMRRAIVIITDNVVLIARVGSVAKICVCEISDVYFRSMDPFKLRQLRFIFTEGVDMIIARFAGFNDLG
jgi:hypothetical protein